MGQAVLVTARVHDPDDLKEVNCAYRVDPALEVIRLPMVDDGTGGDLLAGDGIYSVVLPSQSTTNLLAFTIEATDAHAVSQATKYPGDSPRRECLIRWGEPTVLGNLGTYRVWMTRATLAEWEGREPSSNDPLPVTFVYGHQRVVYGASALYSGSPFHWGGYDSPVGLKCNYVLQFPTDERFLGATDFVLNLPANLGSDRSNQREQFFYAMAREIGRPYAYRRFCHVIVNGQVRVRSLKMPSNRTATMSNSGSRRTRKESCSRLRTGSTMTIRLRASRTWTPPWRISRRQTGTGNWRATAGTGANARCAIPRMITLGSLSWWTH